MEGWIKLHRRILENGILRDQNASIIFIWLLLKVDRNTGKKTIGRFWASEELGMKPGTFYDALKRLEKKWKVATLKPNNQFTEVSLINWYKYQSPNTEPNNQPTTSQQPDNTLQEVKNKELRKQQEEKIPNSLILSKGMIIAYAKEYPGISSTEIEEQRKKCNAYMNMSSTNYTNPGLFFKGWLKKYMVDKQAKEFRDGTLKRIQEAMPELTEEERQKNLEHLAEMKKSLKLGVNR